MSNPEQSPYDDVITLGDIAAVLTDRTLLRQFGVVALALFALGVAVGLLPVVVGQFGDSTMLELAASGDEVSAQAYQNELGRLAYIFVPYFAPVLATMVAFVAGVHREGSRRKAVPAVMAGALVGCVLFFLASTWIPHSQFAVVENSFPFDETVPPYDTVGVLLNGTLSGLVGAIGALVASLAGSVLN
ncbi:hypothetical protein [Haloarchaeobius sp. DYHT-AS-18]|uniref:hypothetical protein n=1 Tax=Haloarchaeobius sp. DYHT-AS-18 TaxID=3446117 RepID=UPI003EBEE9E3